MTGLEMALLGAGIQTGGGLIGYGLSQIDRARAEEMIRQATDEYGNIDLPALERLVAEQQGATELSKIHVDPRLKEAQMAALGQFDNIIDSGGHTLEDKAVLNEIIGDTERQASAAHNSIRNQMAARGVQNSGADLAMQLSAGQAASGRASQQGLDIAAQAQRRALDAILAKGNMAGNIRSQDYGEQRDRYSAQDLINRYNTGNRQEANRYNVGLGQQNFQNQLSLADRKAKGKYAMADLYNDNADRTQQTVGGVANAAGQGVQGYGYYQQGQERPMTEAEKKAAEADKKARGD